MGKLQLSPFSQFSPFANGELPFVSSSTNGQMTNLCLQDKQIINGLRKMVWASIYRLILSPCSCLRVHVSMFMFPCVHVLVSMSPSLHVSMSHVYVSVFPCSYFPFIRILITENGNFHLNSTNGKRKRQSSGYLLQTEMENGSLFSLVSKE
jgi:hypothetical protein